MSGATPTADCWALVDTCTHCQRPIRTVVTNRDVAPWWHEDTGAERCGK